jgi:cytochrome c oxidase accessory protein FixG
LAYLIGIDELKSIVTDPISEHTGSLIAIIVFTSVFFAVFAWFREQVCTTVCPYGRLQGVLLDKNSIVVAYDYKRGEERAKFRKNENRKEGKKGDCIDCKQCVNVCPTGIDIRNGTQLECINCTLCMDACDHMMNSVGLEPKLIRYDSEESIKTGKKWRFTPRVKAYIVLMFAVIGLLGTLIVSRSEIEATILRVKGTSYQKINENLYSNIFNASIMNKTNQAHEVHMEVISDNATVEIIGGDFTLNAGEQIKKEIIVKMKLENIEGSKTPLVIGIFSGNRLIEEEKVNFFGPGF